MEGLIHLISKHIYFFFSFLFTPLLASNPRIPFFFYVMCRSPFNILVKVFLNCWLANA